jgi:glycosyltransferase involved in cell wall biosynthesis
VQVLTGLPNYPGGEIYDGYKVKFIQREVMDGIEVIRVPLYPSHDRSSMKRIMSYMSLSTTQALIGTFAVNKADVAYVSQGPATIGLPAIFHKIFRRIPFVYSIQDLWPDTLLSTGMFKNRFGLKLISGWCKMVYKFASKIVVIAPGMKRRLIERGVPEDKIEVVYNWCDEDMIWARPDNVDIPPCLQDEKKFNVVFAGNMGKAQAMDSVIKAAELLKDECPNLQFVLIGSGVEVEPLKAKVKEAKLSNVVFLPRKPISEIGTLLQKADALLVHLRNDPLFEITVPSKTQAYLATGKPIIIGVKGDAADLVEQAMAGIRCEPENAQSIAKAVRRLYTSDKQTLNEMGQNGLNFYKEKLSFQTAIERYSIIFNSLRIK